MTAYVTQLDRVLRARQQVVIEAQRVVDRHPNEYATLRLALKALNEAEREKALHTIELHGIVRSRPRPPAEK